MQKVNLSRLNNEIKELRSRIGEARSELSSMRKVFALKVFEGTTDADIKAFDEDCKTSRAEMFHLMDSIGNDVRYLCELRAILDRANRKYGVLDILRDIAALQTRRDVASQLCSILRDGVNNAAMGEACDCGTLRDAAFYKGAFTDQTRTYILREGICVEDDVKAAAAKVKSIEWEIREKQDALAAVNQRKFVRIPSPEEFLASRQGSLAS